ncbi:hypothetical protein [Actinoplanes sp. CA-252034]|uniref:hypothetical protein n=1 Tax=Actinoplanes sp. CA-252034 TaxID=3239906 RepID=UPI003D95397E
MSDVRADLPAIEAFADRTIVRRDHLDQIRSQLNSTRLPRDAFGYVPGIGGKVHDAYEEFVAQCAEATEMASEIELALGRRIHKAVDLIAQTDQFSADDLDETLHPGVQ